MHVVNFRNKNDVSSLQPDDGIAAFTDTLMQIQLQQVSPMTSVSIDTVCG
jgi:hypothetical protein